MTIQPGAKLVCPACPTEVVVVQPPSTEVALTCGGVGLVSPDDARDASHDSGEGAALGKRYVDETAGIEVLCSKPGQGALACDGRDMPIKGAKPLPASD